MGWAKTAGDGERKVKPWPWRPYTPNQFASSVRWSSEVGRSWRPCWSQAPAWSHHLEEGCGRGRGAGHQNNLKILPSYSSARRWRSFTMDDPSRGTSARIWRSFNGWLWKGESSLLRHWQEFPATSCPATGLVRIALDPCHTLVRDRIARLGLVREIKLYQFDSILWHWRILSFFDWTPFLCQDTSIFSLCLLKILSPDVFFFFFTFSFLYFIFYLSLFQCNIWRCASLIIQLSGSHSSICSEGS